MSSSSSETSSSVDDSQTTILMRKYGKRVNAIFKAKLLHHPDSGKLAAYMISSGELYPEVAQLADALMQASMDQVVRSPKHSS